MYVSGVGCKRQGLESYETSFLFFFYAVRVNDSKPLFLSYLP